jgi:2'-5' RNA ligase
MQFFVQLRFTDASSERVIALQQRLASALGVVLDTCLKPHITLGAGMVDDAEVLAVSLQAALQTKTAFDVRLVSPGVFGGERGVLFLSPAHIRALIALYEKLLPHLERYAQSLHVLYTPAFWVPTARC